MDKKDDTQQVRTPSQNWSLLADFTHASKSIVNPVIYQEVLLDSSQRAERLLKQFNRFSDTLNYPRLHIATRKWLISCIDLVDMNEKLGRNEYTMDHLKNEILEKVIKTTSLKIVV